MKTTFTCTLLLPILALAGARAAEKASPLVKTSPFSSPAAAAAAPAASETLEFAGVSSIGAKTDLIIYDKSVKKSHWIPIGETKEGISVLSYDSTREQVQIRVNGTEKSLPLRKPASAPGGPRPVAPLPPAASFSVATPLPAAAEMVKVQPPPPAAGGASIVAVSPTSVAPNVPVPATPDAQLQQKQETEARMLVSDLLEIGMAQRRAYEEQQRRAAAGGAAGANASPPATTADPAAQKQ